EVDAQPVGDEGTVFIGNDLAARVYSVQQLFHRQNIVVAIEATGPVLAEQPEIVLSLARVVDNRLKQGASGWPAVSVPTVVGDAQLSAPPQAGQGLHLGGFAGLASLDGDGTRFVAVTDRGPIAELDCGPNQLMFMPLPAFTPSIVKLQVGGGRVEVTERLGLHLPRGYIDPRTGTPFVSGLPRGEADSAAFDGSGQYRWGTDAYGLDPGGIAVDPRDASYWVCESYGPSILHVDPEGAIQLRLVPGGVDANLPGLDSRATLPAELAKRQLNRGFKGIAISPNGQRLFAIMESPLANPDDRTGRGSRSVRLITLDLAGGEPRLDGMYVYLTEPADQVGV